MLQLEKIFDPKIGITLQRFFMSTRGHSGLQISSWRNVVATASLTIPQRH
jgi:hypothetical protein